MAPVKPTLSALQWLSIGGSLVKILSLALVAVVVGPFRRPKGFSFGRYLRFAISRAFTGSFSARTLVAITPTTDEGYRKFTSSQKIEPKSITLADGTQVHWLGDPSAEKVLLYFHGMELLHQTLQAIERRGGRLGVLFLSYDVSIHAAYPRQLQQASALLRHVLTTLAKKPANILLAGDSAGGNLALALLSHILHPHPKVDPVAISGRLAGAALLSPWVTFATTAKSFRANQYRDALAEGVLNEWSGMFQGDAKSDPYLEPLSAEEDWWKDLPISRVLVLVGGDELFVDDIEAFGKRMGNVLEGVVMKTMAGEAHDELVMEFINGTPRTQQREAFEGWLCDIACI